MGFLAMDLTHMQLARTPRACFPIDPIVSDRSDRGVHSTTNSLIKL
jgi:hypothetical protein